MVLDEYKRSDTSRYGEKKFGNDPRLFSYTSPDPPKCVFSVESPVFGLTNMNASGRLPLTLSFM